jgi:hypothetical protein
MKQVFAAVRRIVVPAIAAAGMLSVGSTAWASPNGDAATDWFASSHSMPSHPHSVMSPAASATRGGAGRAHVSAGRTTRASSTGSTSSRASGPARFAGSSHTRTH